MRQHSQNEEIEINKGYGIFNHLKYNMAQGVMSTKGIENTRFQ